MLGGSFSIASAPAQGTTATLVLPLARRDVRDKRDMRDEGNMRDKRDVGEPVSLLSPVSRVSPSTRMRVLLVDDHAMVRQGLKSILDAYQDISVSGEAARWRRGGGTGWSFVSGRVRHGHQHAEAGRHRGHGADQAPLLQRFEELIAWEALSGQSMS